MYSVFAGRLDAFLQQFYLTPIPDASISCPVLNSPSWVGVASIFTVSGNFTVLLFLCQLHHSFLY